MTMELDCCLNGILHTLKIMNFNATLNFRKKCVIWSLRSLKKWWPLRDDDIEDSSTHNRQDTKLRGSNSAESRTVLEEGL